MFDKTSYDDLKSPSKPGKIKNEETVRLSAQLLGFENWEALNKILLQSVKVIRNEELWSAQGLATCENNRNSLCKKLYDNMFNWLVIKMNRTIEPAELNDGGFSSVAKTIGLLDIFGFENFEKNQFE